MWRKTNRGAARQCLTRSEIARATGYGVSMQCRKRIEQGFGWAKTIGSTRQVMVRGLKKVDQLFAPNMAACNVVRMRLLGQIRPQAAG